MLLLNDANPITNFIKRAVKYNKELTNYNLILNLKKCSKTKNLKK